MPKQRNDKSNKLTRTRLLGDECGSTTKKWKNVISIGLIYPNTYYVGMSNLGFQTIYTMINERDRFVCERFFVSSQTSSNVVSFESGRRPEEFQILAFSVSFENDFLNIIRFFKETSLKIKRSDRTRFDPLIMAGGAAISINPESIADFFDIFVLGEGDEVFALFLDEVEQVHRKGWDKSSILENSVEITGFYLPGAYHVSYHDEGHIKEVTSDHGYPIHISPARVKSLNQYQVCSKILTPNTEFGNHYLIELARGCSRRCCFCYGGWGYHPLRVRKKDDVLEQIHQGFELFKRCSRKPIFGLIAPSMTDVPDILSIFDNILERQGKFSLSSIPLDFLNENTIERLVKAPVKSITMAPETGTPEQRAIIGKDWNEDHFFSTLQDLWKYGFTRFRFYYMIGLPGESAKEIAGIVHFTKRISHLARQAHTVRNRVSIHLSLNAFIPKPHTPFQWEPMDTTENIKNKIRYIKKELRSEKKVTVTHDVPKWARIQGLIARGDRRVGQFLIALEQSQGNLSRALAKININPSFYLDRNLYEDLILPWQHLTPTKQANIVARRYNEYRRLEKINRL